MSTRLTLRQQTDSQSSAKHSQMTSIWKSRNSCVFDNTQPRTQVVLQEVAEQLSLWAMAGARGLAVDSACIQKFYTY
ncbi:hypothetical protein PVAP13_7KG285885 [Panicum virgatum]|uniref:Uncharacterized protein n=1 Tax=Panicum virgatum TaxID=38727 RepID=A0A8T0QIF3_PANVG|nr:hypothetical protein PVAP13_7KG285885 [Panicum virgatum]